jgi:hypothetical protein
MMGADNEKPRSSKGCEHALDIILRAMEYMAAGFILPPCEVKNMLGIRKNNASWYLHREVGKLKKALARHAIETEVSPVHGIAVRPLRSAFRHPPVGQAEKRMSQLHAPLRLKKSGATAPLSSDLYEGIFSLSGRQS